MKAASILCPEKAVLFKNISLSANSVTSRIEELLKKRVLQIRKKSKNLLMYSGAGQVY